MKPRLSVITPTSERAHQLQSCYGLLKQQKGVEWEWLIYDNSLKPQEFRDERVRYFYDEGIVSIGEKRNRLIEKALGDYIVHMDDDDYYAPNYLFLVSQLLQQSAFCTFHAWFCYDTKMRQFYYHDTNCLHSVRFEVSPFTQGKVREIHFADAHQRLNETLNLYGKKGYGFSYSYRKEVVAKCRFQDLDFGEDCQFYEAVEAAHFPIVTYAGEQGEVIHVIHDRNSSTDYPHYRIPGFLVENVVPSFFTYLKKTYEN